jgi:outer membrane protein OmpA-like peptidoglycan-associated protein
MGFKKILIGAASVMALTTGLATAGYERDGWYVGLEGGWGRVSETDISNEPLEFADGIAVLGTAGYAFTDSKWRIEGEVGYRHNDVDTLDGATFDNGELEEWSGMLNAIYDFNLNSEKWGLGLGAGIGIDNARYTSPIDGHDSNDKVFAFQAIAGLTYRVNQHWDILLNYRYFNAAQAELQYAAQSPSEEVDLEKHSVTIGFRYGYNEPPAPPAEPPVVVPPPAPKQFIVFFGYNKCNITAEADAVLSEAASAAKSSGSASVRIVGHTDTSGSNAYNQKLSECRANAAKTNLVGKGVSEGSISSSGKGETELMVQTGDGVKEPQNRRATIDLN